MTEEDRIQISILSALNLVFPKVIIFHCPNGGHRNKIEAKKLKAMGVRPGVADLVVMLPSGKVGFIEVKSQKGRPSQAQREFARLCREFGIPHSYARSIDDAITAVRAWSAT
jgi:uncharacterized NAD-dependent epimerase/dehydratase family protein